MPHQHVQIHHQLHPTLFFQLPLQVHNCSVQGTPGMHRGAGVSPETDLLCGPPNQWVRKSCHPNQWVDWSMFLLPGGRCLGGAPIVIHTHTWFFFFLLQARRFRGSGSAAQTFFAVTDEASHGIDEASFGGCVPPTDFVGFEREKAQQCNDSPPDARCHVT